MPSSSSTIPVLEPLSLKREYTRFSLPPGFDDALPYQIMPQIASSIPRTTWMLNPCLPNRKNPIMSTNTVFMCPSTWKETALNRPMQMNWLKFVPTAIKHDKTMKNCTFCPPHKSSVQQLKGSQHNAQYHIHGFRFHTTTSGQEMLLQIWAFRNLQEKHWWQIAEY